jgi:uncharacterized protein
MMPILIVPGLGGSGDQHWQTHLERAFPSSVRVHQEEWDRPDLKKWLARLADAVDAIPGAVLVAHSLGCPLVTHLAAEYPDLSVAAALMVAPADVESRDHTPDHTRGFAPIPRRPLPFASIVVASTNDPFMEFARARDLARDWRAEFFDAGPCGHINVAAGYGPWPAGHCIVQSLLVWARDSARIRETLRKAIAVA